MVSLKLMVTLMISLQWL